MVEQAYSRGADVESMMAIVIIDVNSHMRESLDDRSAIWQKMREISAKQFALFLHFQCGSA
jgi:hypothetical protein